MQATSVEQPWLRPESTSIMNSLGLHESALETQVPNCREFCTRHTSPLPHSEVVRHERTHSTPPKSSRHSSDVVQLAQPAGTVAGGAHTGRDSNGPDSIKHVPTLHSDVASQDSTQTELGKPEKRRHWPLAQSAPLPHAAPVAPAPVGAATQPAEKSPQVSSTPQKIGEDHHPRHPNSG